MSRQIGHRIQPARPARVTRSNRTHQRAGVTTGAWPPGCRARSRCRAKFSGAIAIHVRATDPTLEIIPSLDRLDPADDRLSIHEGTIAARTEQLRRCRLGRRGEHRCPLGAFRGRDGLARFGCSGRSRIRRSSGLRLRSMIERSHHVHFRTSRRHLHPSYEPKRSRERRARTRRSVTEFQDALSH